MANTWSSWSLASVRIHHWRLERASILLDNRVEGDTSQTERRQFDDFDSASEMAAEGTSKKMIATQGEMVNAKVPLAYRDQCAHLLIPLNKCRQAEFYLPWKCESERHIYEKCEYELVMERMIQMQKIREQEAKSKQPQGQRIPLIPKTANA